MVTADGRERLDLLACPACDALHSRPALDEGEVAHCVRCHAVILARKHRSVDRVVPAAAAALLAYLVAVTFPFVGVSEAGLANQISVIDAVVALAEGRLGLLAVVLGVFTLAFPLWMIVSLLMVTVPIRLGRPAPRYAAAELKVVRRLAPWAMAEIFLVGTAVSLVKVAGLAHLSFGPAFLGLLATVVLLAMATVYLCEDTIWAAVRAR
ncbi:paraquat-inducible protein A [Parvularcula dongshanensis]|uniref:Paraquat-inducible protein A n=1 Tax=Parvularcula dongshanensis TaxID=1173995 RepID=A0A840I4S0_9PROT|nr:paraquat-inducible protein A [Parvularcula dongshanensis]MBB4659273.1 paraquat-inducible protein A [Parvularcula dongshanensis]